MDNSRLSLWKELSVILFLFTSCIAQSCRLNLFDTTLERLAFSCANSRRKRTPSLLLFACAS